MNAVHPTHAARPVAERQSKEKLVIGQTSEVTGSITHLETGQTRRFDRFRDRGRRSGVDGFDIASPSRQCTLHPKIERLMMRDA